ncbi:MAG: glycogen debranching protein GlgX [Alphaproteobacteria bacterium]|nr:glycogen debranching protein GlgX [Alphaproteobacteria bacterium]MBV9419172.1 glycogen debranching protein GlgX [Alphaproteobacteria bacterium]
MTLDTGRPFPLGATWDGNGVNFAVFSANATRVELCVFEPDGRETRHALPARLDEVWHGYLLTAAPGLVYGYRAYGPYEPRNGHRFNHHKLLLDPYARQLEGDIRWNNALLGYSAGGKDADLRFDRRDSAPFMAKAVVVADNFDWCDDKPPRTAWSDTIIYEAHVKGLTKLLDAVPEIIRGTYAALGHPSVIDHLRRIGVTALELLPVHGFLQDQLLVEQGLSNYWGYNTLSFFAPERRYGAADDLRRAVKALHAAGIEVILDVVYNHTCEGNELGATLSWRGLDNASYYRLVEEDKRHFINDTGTGNTVNLSHPRVIQMVMDSLRHFVQSYHIDGFRFDLCTTLGREPAGFDPGCGFFDALRQDPVLAPVKLIAEPWDIGPGGYQLGNHPAGFSEWNGRFRDTVRRYWRGDEGQRPELAERLAGSSDLFARRRPSASVNFVCAHDGATLADLTMYEGKHNEANGEDNRDGTDENYARNWGEEGPSDDPEIEAVRARVRRSMLATLFWGRGVPMLLGGDELGRTQKGNNNAYCQDNEISWIDWRRADQDLIAFTARVAELRKRYPVMHEDRFRHGDEIAPGFRDLDWLDERDLVLSEEDWKNPEGRALVARRAAKRADGKIEVLALLLNGGEEAMEFSLPQELDWRLLLDSAEPDKPEAALKDAAYTVEAHACAILASVFEASP